MAVARVVRWQGGNPDVVREAARQVQAQADAGPPEGLPATGFVLLVGADGTAIGITFFANEDDMRVGDKTLNEMNPPGEGFGTRGPVEFYEVAAELRV